jgi:hypothetical protein
MKKKKIYLPQTFDWNEIEYSPTEIIVNVDGIHQIVTKKKYRILKLEDILKDEEDDI